MDERHHVPQAEMVRSWYCWLEVWSESHRCILAQFVHWDIPVFFFLIFFRGWAVRVVFSCQFVHSDTLFFGQANFQVRITIYWISLETIVNSIKILSATSLPRIVDHKKLFLCVGFAVPRTVESLLLDDVVLDGESIQSPATQILTGFSFNQEMSTSARNHSFIQIKKTFWALLLLELFHTIRRTLHCPCHESSLSYFCWKGCRCSSTASSLKSLSMKETLDLHHEFANQKFSACFTTACGTPHTLKSMSVDSRCVNKPMDWPLFTSILCWVDLCLRLRLRLCLYSNA